MSDLQNGGISEQACGMWDAENDVDVDDLRYTRAWIETNFENGRSLGHLISDLLSGLVNPVQCPWLTLEAVLVPRWGLFSLCNRRLFCLKKYKEAIRESTGSIVLVRVRQYTLTKCKMETLFAKLQQADGSFFPQQSFLYSEGEKVLIGFFHAYTSRDHGRSVEVRSADQVCSVIARGMQSCCGHAFLEFVLLDKVFCSEDAAPHSPSEGDVPESLFAHERSQQHKVHAIVRHYVRMLVPMAINQEWEIDFAHVELPEHAWFGDFIQVHFFVHCPGSPSITVLRSLPRGALEELPILSRNSDSILVAVQRCCDIAHVWRPVWRDDESFSIRFHGLWHPGDTNVLVIASHEFDCPACHEGAATLADMMVKEQGYILSFDLVFFRFTMKYRKFGIRAFVREQADFWEVYELMPQLFPQSFDLHLCGHTLNNILGFRLWPAQFEELVAERMTFV